jgi:hypothetical protein
MKRKSACSFVADAKFEQASTGKSPVAVKATTKGKAAAKKDKGKAVSVAEARVTRGESSKSVGGSGAGAAGSARGVQWVGSAPPGVVNQRVHMMQEFGDRVESGADPDWRVARRRAVEWDILITEDQIEILQGVLAVQKWTVVAGLEKYIEKLKSLYIENYHAFPMNKMKKKNKKKKKKCRHR